MEQVLVELLAVLQWRHHLALLLRSPHEEPGLGEDAVGIALALASFAFTFFAFALALAAPPLVLHGRLVSSPSESSLLSRLFESKVRGEGSQQELRVEASASVEEEPPLPCERSEASTSGTATESPLSQAAAILLACTAAVPCSTSGVRKIHKQNIREGVSVSERVLTLI